MATLVAEREYQVTEKDCITNTDLAIQTGDRLVLTAWGKIYAGVIFTGENGPEGWNGIDLDPKFPLTGSHPYCLFGSIAGNNFFIGNGRDLVYQGPGDKLVLRINDDSPANGSGAFHCRVQVWRQL